MEKIVKILFFFVLLFFAKNVNSKSPPPGTGSGDVPANIMIMLDNSQSMLENLDGSYGSTTSGGTDIAFDNSGNIYVAFTFNTSDVKVYNS